MTGEKISALQYAKVMFEGFEIPCAISNDLNVYIPINNICEILGIETAPQVERIREHHALRQGLAKMDFSVSYGDKGANTTAEVNVISLTRFHTWLVTIPTKRINKDESRQRLELFQEKCADTIYAYFGRPVEPADIRAEKTSSLPVNMQEFYTAIDRAREARDLAQTAVDKISALEDRLNGIEMALIPKTVEFITPQQQRLFLSWVNILGDLLVKKGAGDIPTVHNELKNQFSFTSYKLIPAEKFHDIRKFCINWYKKLVPAGTPLPQTFNDPEQKRLL